MNHIIKLRRWRERAGGVPRGEVDKSALPPGAGAVNVRWQRGSKLGAGTTNAARGHWDSAVGAVGAVSGFANDGYSTTFKTILGAKSASYTLTRSDVGCIIRAIGAGRDSLTPQLHQPPPPSLDDTLFQASLHPPILDAV